MSMASNRWPGDPLPPSETPETEKRRHAEWESLSKVLDQVITDYEMDWGEDGYYNPTDEDRVMLRDFIEGLLADEVFISAFSECYPVRSRFEQRLRALRGEREGMVMMPNLETEAMQDAARGIIQILRARPGCTEHDVYLHCKRRGDSTKGLYEHDGAYVTEARAIAMIYRAMLSARPQDERKE